MRSKVEILKLVEFDGERTAENLAADEVMLDWVDDRGTPVELLRLWENPEVAVVMGRSSRTAVEVNSSFCQANSIPVFRRSSGGAAVVIGPGCLMYSLVLDYRLRPELRMLDAAHRCVMETLRSSLSEIGHGVAFQGTCDLTLHNKKFSGNSLRCKRNALLYHGTLLYEFPLELIAQCLGTPPRQPTYREGRDHERFVTNFPVDAPRLRRALRAGWNVSESIDSWPRDRISQLATAKYENESWTNSR